MHVSTSKVNSSAAFRSIQLPISLTLILRYLSSRYRVVPLAELLESVPEEPTVAITFDDGFRSVHDNAWPLLRERGIPATCYLTTSVISNDTLIWLNELNWFLHRHPELAISASRLDSA